MLFMLIKFSLIKEGGIELCKKINQKRERGKEYGKDKENNNSGAFACHWTLYFCK